MVLRVFGKLTVFMQHNRLHCVDFCGTALRLWIMLKGRFMRMFCGVLAVVILSNVAVKAEAFLFQHNGHFYAVIPDEVSWAEAEAMCRKHGGHLISINDEAENNFVRQCFQRLGIQFGWIGLSSDDNGGQQWVNGDAVSYRNFAPGDDRDNRSYFNINVRNGEWVGSNRLFGAKRAYMCESKTPLARGGWTKNEETRPRPRPEVKIPDQDQTTGPVEETKPVPGFHSPREVTPPKPKVDVEALAKQVGSSRVVVEIEQARQGILISTPGVMVGDQGLVLIPSGVLAYASEANLKLGNKDQVELEPVTVDPYSGMALLRVKEDSLSRIKSLEGLEVGEVHNGQELFVIEIIGSTIDLRRVDVRKLTEQRDATGKRLLMDFGASDSFSWEQAGSPIVDDKGKLVGMTVFSKPTLRPQVHFDEQQSEQPWGQPSVTHEAEPVVPTFDAVALSPSSTLMKASEANMTFHEAQRVAVATATAYKPTVVSIKPRGSARAVRLVALRIEKRLVCQGCEGDGIVIREVKVGEEIRGGFKRAIYDKQEFECKACGSTGLVSDQQLARTLEDLTAAFARMDPKDPDADKAYDAVRECFATMYNEHRWDHFLIKMDHMSADVMERGSLKPGESLTIVGMPQHAGLYGLSEQDYLVIEVGVDRKPVVLEQPLIRSVESQTLEVTAGGIVVGWITDTKGERIPVLGHGFVTNHVIR